MRSLAPRHTALSYRRGLEPRWAGSQPCALSVHWMNTLCWWMWGSRFEEMPRKAPRWWEVGGRTKFRTRVLALGEAGPFCGNSRVPPAARGSCVVREGPSAQVNTVGGIQPDLGLHNSPQAAVWLQSPEISSSSAWPVPGPGVNLCPQSLCGRAGRDRVSCLLQGGTWRCCAHGGEMYTFLLASGSSSTPRCNS